MTHPIPLRPGRAKLFACATIALAAFPAMPAFADSWIVGTGASYFSHRGAPTVASATIEWQAERRWQYGRWQIGPAASFEFDSRHNYWIGAGIAAHRDFGRWFVELSEMPGYYRNGSPETDLGGPLEFRSLLAFGYRIEEHTGLSLALYHRSNAGFRRRTQGSTRSA